MSKQPPFQSNHPSRPSAHALGQPPQSYEDERSMFQNPFHNPSPYFPNIPPPSQNFQGAAGHLAHPRTSGSSGSSSQWPPLMPHIPIGYPQSPNNRSDPPVAGGSRSPGQKAVISIPPCQTSSFKVKASRDSNVDEPEAEGIFEEKRQRNTAASARFRVRKKERNQQLEQTVSHLSTRAEELEREASDLRRENTWLKEIVIMKGRQNVTASSSSSSRKRKENSTSKASTSTAKDDRDLSSSSNSESDSESK